MMTTSHKTKWREARMQIQQEKDKMKLPDGRTCNHCAHIEHCKWLFSISGNETVCSIYPSRFYDDVMTIYHRDGTKTEVVHPFDAMRKCEIHNHADISGEISTDVNEQSNSDVSTTQDVLMDIKSVEQGSTEPDFDKMPIKKINQYLLEHGYDPEKVGLRGKILVEALTKNIIAREIIQRLLADPGGCRFCDFGVLRKPDNPLKGHDEDCPYLAAHTYLDSETSTGVKRDLSDAEIEELGAQEAERKEFCPNCEAEVPCTHEAELYVCDICGEDFAKYIVSRISNVSDVSMT